MAAERVRRRVLVVDDSAFMRRMVSDLVASSGEFEVVGTACDGMDALRQLPTLDPELVTLDIDMPQLDGLACLDRIMRDWPRPVVMLSADASDAGDDVTRRALARGAAGCVRKPSGPISLDLELVRDQLLAALRAAAAMSPVRGAPGGGYGSAAPPLSGAPRALVCIASSTGGPAALTQVIPALPWFEQAAVLVVQHMPVGFTASFARRLHTLSRVPVHEARHGEPLRAGHVYLAPGGVHMRVGGPRYAPETWLDEEPPLWGVRPAADPLFTSAADYVGAACVGVVLTGMGRDGADGLHAVRSAGGIGIVQDRATCVVDSMPESALRIAGADEIVALPDVASAIVRHLATRVPRDRMMPDRTPRDHEAVVRDRLGVGTVPRPDSVPPSR